MTDINSAILSGDEVERLLTSFHEGKLDVEQSDVIEEGGIVKYYDFKRPNTISREKRRMLYKLYEATAYHMSKEITNYLKSSVKVNLDSIDELSFGIFKNTCPELVFVETVKLKPMQGFGCITIDLGLCLSIAERAYGGQGKSQTEVRKLTDLEVSSEDIKKFHESLDQRGIIYFSEKGELTQSEIEEIENVDIELEGKTKNKRLISVIWRNCEKYHGRKPTKKESHLYYHNEMEKIIEHYKGKLDD